MSLHLVTGYAGSEHITSKDQGAYNIATFGGGNFVFDRLSKFSAAKSSSNTITIAEGEAMIQGRYVKTRGVSESVTIESGTVGMFRNDLICIRYEKSSVNNTESADLVVIKGTPTTGTPADPSYNNSGNITDGTATILDFPLYRVRLNGVDIESLTALFSVKVSMADYMDNYQMPKATGSAYGAVKVGSGVNVNDGVISVTPYSLPTASASTKGGVKIGSGINVSGDVISVPTYSLPNATYYSLGGVKIGNGITVKDGEISVSHPTIPDGRFDYQDYGSSVSIPAKGYKKITITVPSVPEKRQCIYACIVLSGSIPEGLFGVVTRIKKIYISQGNYRIEIDCHILNMTDNSCYCSDVRAEMTLVDDLF